mgnify:CR=1 FL=1
MATRQDARASHISKHSALFVSVLLSLAVSTKPARKDRAGNRCDKGIETASSMIWHGQCLRVGWHNPTPSPLFQGHS